MSSTDAGQPLWVLAFACTLLSILAVDSAAMILYSACAPDAERMLAPCRTIPESRYS